MQNKVAALPLYFFKDTLRNETFYDTLKYIKA
jgi:hypothetical protein